MKKVLKSKIFIVIITMIICISGTLYATTKYQASEILFNPSGGESITVNDALNEIYNIKTLGDATEEDIVNGKKAVVQGKLITGTKTIKNGGYVALFQGSSSITTSTTNLNLSYFNTAYGVKNSNTAITLNVPGTYRIIGTVSHSPFMETFSSIIRLYINGKLAHSITNNYETYDILNYKLVVSSGETYSINTTLYSDGNKNGIRGGMLVVIKEA